MKKSILTFALMTFAIVSLSQIVNQVNGDAVFTKTVGIEYVNVKTLDSTSYSILNVQANKDAVGIGLITFGTNGGVGTLYDNNTAYVSGAADKMGIINEQTNGYIVFATGGYGASKEAMRINSNGQIMIEANNPTHPVEPSAYLNIARGTATAGHAPLKLTTAYSVLLTIPEAGAIETDGTDLYWTNNSGVRKKLVLQ